MPCLKAPPITLPTLPPGISIPIFPGYKLPSLGLCCNIKIPPFDIPIPAIGLTIAFPPAVIDALDGYLSALQKYYDLLQVPCPKE